MSSGLAMKAHSLWKIGFMGRGYEPLYQTKSEKSSIDVLGFYQQKKDSKVSKEEGSESSSKPPKASLPKSGTSTKSLEKVTPISVHPNFSNPAAYPSVRDLEDLLLGFKGQPITKKKKKTFRILYTNLRQNRKNVM